MAILINDTAPRNQYTATSGQTVFTVSFEFFENADLKVYKNAVLQTITTHYTVTGAGVTGGGSITLTSGATTGDIITIVRDIPVKRVTDFPTSGPFNISALNTELDKIVAMVQEREDDITRVVQLSETDTSTTLTLPIVADRASKVLGFDATGSTIAMQEIGNYRGNWAAGTAYVLRDIVKDTSNANIYICVQAHTSSGSQPLSTNANAASWALLVDAATATSSASAAASSASAAASSASAASGSASAASGSASSAASSASSAASAQSAAESARDATLAAYDNFDDRYLGAKTSNPTLDNDGNTLVAGALYFNSVAGEMRLWTGSAWVAAYVSGSGFLSTSGGTITGDLVVSASGSTNALRITQTGTGNALVVEDAANPDSSPVVVDSSGNVIVGYTQNIGSPLGYPLQQHGVSANVGLGMSNWVNAVGAPNIRLAKSRGSAIGSYTAVQSGDELGIIQFYGDDGTQFIRGANIVAAVDGTPGLNDMPGRLMFSTTADGASTPTERMRIASAGQIGIGGANYGTAGQVLTSGGAAAAPSWAAVSSTGALKNVQVFTSSGTYTRTAGVTTAVVIAVGGGGGGKGANGTTPQAGGSGGAGGTTSFGAHVSAAGGSGANSESGAAGGTGGTGATIAIRGAPGPGNVGGGQGGGTQVSGAAGVAGVRGGGGSGGSYTNCNNYTGGGGGQGETAIKYTTTVGATETVTIGAGGTAGTSNVSRPGGAGGAGYIIVYEYS